MKKIKTLIVVLFLLSIFPSCAFAVSISRIDNAGNPIITSIADSVVSPVITRIVNGVNTTITKLPDTINPPTISNVTQVINNFLNYTETDPIAMAYFANYYSKFQSDARFYPLYSNPSDYVNQSELALYLSSYYNKTESDDRYLLRTFDENFTVSVVGGSGSGISQSHSDWVLTRIAYVPSSLAYAYNSQAFESANDNIIDRDRIQHVGTWGLFQNYALDGSITVNLTNATDGSYIVEISYFKDGIA